MQSIHAKLKKSVKAFRHFPYVAIALSAGLLSYSLWCGIGLTFDSLNYLASAKNFAVSGLLINADGKPNITQAPLFAVFLSVLNHRVMDLVRIFHLVFFTATMLIILNILQKLVKNQLFISVAIAMTSFAVGTQMIYNFVWSEPLFFLLFALHNWVLIRYLKTRKMSDLLLLAIMALLMGVSRNAGIFIIFATLIGLLIIPQQFERRATFWYGIIATSGFAVWNFYTFYMLKGAKGFLEGLSVFNDKIDPLISYLDILLAWFLPGIIPLYLRLIMMCLVILIISSKLKRGNIRPESAFFLLQSGVYIFFILTFFRMYQSDAERFFSVVLPWVIIGVFIILEMINWQRISHRVIIIVMTISLSYMIARSIKNSIFWHRNHCEELLPGFPGTWIDYPT